MAHDVTRLRLVHAGNIPGFRKELILDVFRNGDQIYFVEHKRKLDITIKRNFHKLRAVVGFEESKRHHDIPVFDLCGRLRKRKFVDRCLISRARGKFALESVVGAYDFPVGFARIAGTVRTARARLNIVHESNGVSDGVLIVAFNYSGNGNRAEQNRKHYSERNQLAPERFLTFFVHCTYLVLRV